MVNKNSYVLYLGILAMTTMSSFMAISETQMVFGDICSSSSVCIATGGDGGPGGEGGRGGDTGDAFGG